MFGNYLLFNVFRCSCSCFRCYLGTILCTIVFTLTFDVVDDEFYLRLVQITVCVFDHTTEMKLLNSRLHNRSALCLKINAVTGYKRKEIMFAPLSIRRFFSVESISRIGGSFTFKK